MSDERQPIDRVRNPYLRDVLRARADGGDVCEELVTKTLGQQLLGNLSSPRFELRGRTFDEDERLFRAGDTGTNYPGDECPEVIEALLNSFTEEGDRVVALFVRSKTCHAVGTALNRQVVAVSPYDLECPEIIGTDLRNPSWQTISHHVLGEVGKGTVDDLVQLLYIHGPSPGVIDDLAVIKEGRHEDPVGFVEFPWSDLDITDFLVGMSTVVQKWESLMMSEAPLFIEAGWCKDEHGRVVESWPYLLEIIEDLDWRLSNRWSLEIDPDPTVGTASLPEHVRRNSTLLSFERRSS